MKFNMHGDLAGCPLIFRPGSQLVKGGRLVFTIGTQHTFCDSFSAQPANMGMF
jgi:hypothetical protein